jgi:hypothetical protein
MESTPMVRATYAQRPGAAQVPDGSRDFDFLAGRYRVRRQAFRGHGETAAQWETFDAHSLVTPLPRGLGRIDELLIDGEEPGATLRLYDPGSRRWSLYGMDPRSGMLRAPLHGAFAGGVGVFEGWSGEPRGPQRARLIWSHITAATARCERAVSAGPDAPWETRWIMHLSRLDAPHAPAAAEPGLTVATQYLFSDLPRGD